MPNFTRLEMIMDKGTMILGKYTFPKIAALVLKVSLVVVKQVLK
jgi:hypothetical protein